MEGFSTMKLMVTGGAGFIGSAVIRRIIHTTEHSVVNIDKLTYAGNLENLQCVTGSDRYFFEQVDICNRSELERVLNLHQPDAIMHLAAESHVDRSIDAPSTFIETNILGTYNLLEIARHYWSRLKSNAKGEFRFHHVSTDEVYGDLPHPDYATGEEFGSAGMTLPSFAETTAYAPSSPYSSSKASSDHLVRAWHRTFGLPVVVSNCSNNYGPRQFPEKLIPHIILSALRSEPLPVYGKGDQIRDWLYVEDHAQALLKVVIEGRVGETYNIGGQNEKRNIEVIHTICEVLQELVPSEQNYKRLISFVEDRPGHDLRYALNAEKIKSELGWTPSVSFDVGIRQTVEWYLENKGWCQRVLSGEYRLERAGQIVQREK